jgi:acyl-CoA synthetase (NDP forming)
VLTPEQAELQARARAFVEEVLMPLEVETERARGRLPAEAVDEAGVGVAVLEVGVSAAGASAAAARAGADAGDHAAFRALVEEAGGAWADDVHDLLELAKALAVSGAHPRGAGGLAILTCSGGDSGLGADEAARLGLDLPALAPATRDRLSALLPPAATVGNPLDYTALIWGEVPTLRDTIAAVGEDPGIDHVLVFYDQPPGLEGAVRESWDNAREGIRAGADASPVPTLVGSTLPELLDDGAACELAQSGVAAVAGLRTALKCAAALRRPRGDAARLRAIAAAARASSPGTWLDEAGAKTLLAGAGIRVPPGQIARDEFDAAEIFARLGRPVALKVVAEGLLHKTDAGAIALGLADERNVRWAYRDLVRPRNPTHPPPNHHSGEVLVEAMAPAGVELLVSARRDAVVPVLTVGLGGVWTEVLGDAVVVPLPADAQRVERALRSLRAAPLLDAVDLAGAAALAARVGALPLERDLELIELEPVLVNARGAVAVGALVRTGVNA